MAIATGTDNVDLQIFFLALIDADDVFGPTYKSTTVVSFGLCSCRDSRSQSSVIDLSCGRSHVSGSASKNLGVVVHAGSV